MPIFGVTTGNFERTSSPNLDPKKGVKPVATPFKSIFKKC